MLELDPKSYKLLKHLYKIYDWTQIPFCREIEILFDKQLVDAKTKYDDPPFDDIIQRTGDYIINDKGITLILNRRHATWQWWIPIIVSALALAISILALLKP